MKYVDEFRDRRARRRALGEILSLVEPGRHYKLIEVCGGHTHSIDSTASDDLLPRTSSWPTARLPGLRDPDGRVDDGSRLPAAKT